MRWIRRGAAAGVAVVLMLGGTTAGAAASGATRGCAANTATEPAGATTARVGDLDGDSRGDTEFVTEDYRFGIRTASGSVHTVDPPLSTPGRLAGWAARLRDGPTVAVVDSGRAALLYAFVGCRFVPVKNVQGQQYSFWLGGNGPEPIRGTGVACGPTGRLEGVLARQHADGRFTIDRTRVIVSGTRARNGGTSIGRAEHAPRSAATHAAESSTCGSVPVVENSGN